MHFDLIDTVLELSEDRIVTIKNVTAAEEYLQDHFPTFPVLPGVLMLEALVQSARRLLRKRDPELSRHVLGEVKALKYGTFVLPGDTLRVEVVLHKVADAQRFVFKGSALALRGGASEGETPQIAVSGRFVLRPPTIGASPAIG